MLRRLGGRLRSEAHRLRNTVAALRQSKADLRNEIERLRSETFASRRVGLIDWGELKVFMYTDDLAYRGVDERYKQTRLVQDRLAPAAIRPQSISELYANPRTDILERLFCHYWMHDLDFTYIDVGCQYGSAAIVAARFIEACGRHNRIHCFEPGVAGNLVPHNLKLNSMASRIVFERAAVTDGDHPVILFAEHGHSENNRVVNRDLRTELLSYVVDGISIDTYAATHNLKDLILKIDTQGGEYDVLAGMAQTLEKRLATAIVEFTPEALSTRTNPGKWLSQFDSHYLLDIPAFGGPASDGQAYALIDPRTAELFADEVHQRPSRYTDVLFIPKTLPNAMELLGLLTKAH